MQLSFRTLSTFTAALCLLLSLVWGLAPQWLLTFWDIEFSFAAELVARRTAVLFAAFSVISCLVRNAPPLRNPQCAGPRFRRRLLGIGGAGFCRMARRPCRAWHVAGGRG
jgi:hypothetical protein